MQTSQLLQCITEQQAYDKVDEFLFLSDNHVASCQCKVLKANDTNFGLELTVSPRCANRPFTSHVGLLFSDAYIQQIIIIIGLLV